LDIPAVTITYAQSIDGRIATSTGSSQWISCPETLELAHNLRRETDVVLVGIETVLNDDPELTCRIGGGPSPVRVVLDSHLRLPPDSRIAQTASEHRTIVFTSRPVHQSKRDALEDRKIEVRTTGVDREGRICIREVMQSLYASGYRKVLVEGGGRIITSFLKEGIVRKMYIVTAPKILGAGVDAVRDLGILKVGDALEPSESSFYSLGRDLVWELTFDLNKMK
jgi:riboflavin-specific deaminase-like protein